MLELINRARANPGAEAASVGINLNEGLPAGTIQDTPKQPVAFNFYLNGSADGHSQWMLDNDVFQHAGAGNSTPSMRATAAGYTLQAPWGVGENLAWKGLTNTVPNPIQLTTELHAGLFIDEGIADRGHRTNMLAPNFKEIGVGILSGVFTQGSKNYNSVMITYDMAYSSGNAFLTGVVFNDYDFNQFYSPTGEGYGDISIRAYNTLTGELYETTSFSTGGYSLQVPAGTYNVTMGGTQLLDTTFLGVTIGSQNIKLDLIDSLDLRPWSNPLNQFDVNGDGNVEPHDVLLLIDELNRNGARLLDSAPIGGPPSLFMDVNRDQTFSAADILRVIDTINHSAQSGFLAGESF